MLVSSADRSSDCVNRTHKRLPYYCLCEGTWYTKKHCLILIWDVDDLESVDLPLNDADIVILSVKHHLPVRWIAENAKSFLERVLTSPERLSKLNPTASFSLNEVFATIMSANRHTSDSWERSSDNPRERAMMIDIVYKVARQHHDRFECAYAPYEPQFNSKLFLKVTSSF